MKMHLRPLLALVAVVALALTARADRKSPHETTSTVVAGSRVTVTYGRPYTKSPKTGEIRIIWGGLVPWDEPDRLGADEATLLLTEKPLVFGPTTLPAGAYTLYQIPHASGGLSLAFSSAIGKWGVPVDTQHDVARIELAAASLPAAVDQLTIAIAKDAATGGGVLKISWEKTAYSVPFTVAK